MIWLRLLHIVGGIVWVGSALFGVLFLFPTARGLGAEGGRFIERLRRRMGPGLGIAMLLTIVPGFIMFGQLSASSNGAWARSRTGMAMGAGALAAILAVIVGIAVNAPAGSKIAALLKAGTPTGEQAAHLARLQGRVERGAQAVAVLLLIAAGAMAVARYL